MRAKTKLVGLVAAALLLVSAAGCGSSGSSDSSSSKKTTTTTTTTAATTTTAPKALSPDLKACAMAGYIASGGPTDGATWLKVVQTAESLKASNAVIDPLRAIAASYVAKDKAAASKALAQFNAVCKQYG